MKSEVEQNASRETEMCLVDAILGAGSAVSEEHIKQLLRCCEKQVRYFAWKFDLEENELLQMLSLHLIEDNWRRLRTFKGTSTLATWFGKIVYRLCLNNERGQKRERKRVVPMPEAEKLEERESLHQQDPELAPLVNGLSASELHIALQKLPEDHRALLIAYYWDGLSGEEIAKLFDLSLKNVRVKLHRIKKRLHEILEENHND